MDAERIADIVWERIRPALVEELRELLGEGRDNAGDPREHGDALDALGDLTPDERARVERAAARMAGKAVRR